MLTKFKKSFTIALAVVMCLTAVCASAATWRIRDYRTDNVVWDSATYSVIPSVPIEYAEYDDMGNFTGRTAVGNQAIQYGLRPTAAAEFKNPWFDIYYPNNEFASVYADGKNLGVYLWTGRAGVANVGGNTIDSGLVEYKDVDYMWEVAAPFGIYSIKKAKLNVGGQVKWFGTPEYGYPTEYTGRNANVNVQRFPYGFADYEITGDNQVTLVPGDLYAPVDYVAASIDAIVGAGNLAPVANATYLEVSPSPVQVINYDALGLNIQVPRSYDYALVGPAYDEVGNEIPGGKTITASKYEINALPNRNAELASFNVANLLDTVTDRFTGVAQMCDITWTAAGYETTSPHRVFENLTIDGVVMDGSYIGEFNGIHFWRPNIIAYTGAVANVY